MALTLRCPAVVVGIQRRVLVVRDAHVSYDVRRDVTVGRADVTDESDVVVVLLMLRFVLSHRLLVLGRRFGQLQGIVLRGTELVRGKMRERRVDARAMSYLHATSWRLRSCTFGSRSLATPL